MQHGLVVAIQREGSVVVVENGRLPLAEARNPVVVVVIRLLAVAKNEVSVALQTGVVMVMEETLV